MSATGRHDSNVRSSLPASHAIQNAHPYTRSSQESTGKSFLEWWQWWIVKEHSTPADFSLGWFWHVLPMDTFANRCCSLLEKKHVSILSAVGRSPEVINCQWPFQVPKLEVLYQSVPHNAFFVRIFPCIALTLALKWPLTVCSAQPVDYITTLLYKIESNCVCTCMYISYMCDCVTSCDIVWLYSDTLYNYHTIQWS